MGLNINSGLTLGATPIIGGAVSGNISTTFGALTAAGEGGVAVTGTSIASGDPSGHWQIIGGILTPSATGATANLNAGPYSLTLDDGQTVSITILANDAHVSPETGFSARAAAVSALAASPAVDGRVMMRPGSYGTTSATVFAINNVVMAGRIAHANTDIAALIASPGTFTDAVVGAFSGGSITFTPDGGNVTWRDRTQFNNSNGIGFAAGVTFQSDLAGTPIISIVGSAATTLGDFLFTGCFMRSVGTTIGTAGAGISIQGAGRVRFQDCDLANTNNIINNLGCLNLEVSRTFIWSWINDALAQRNEVADTMGGTSVICHIAYDHTIIVDRAAGDSHADCHQGSSTNNSLRYQHFVYECTFGPYAQGFFIGDTGNTDVIDITISSGTPVENRVVTYGDTGTEYVGEIRLDQVGAPTGTRFGFTRGDIRGTYGPALVKGDPTLPMPKNGDTITNADFTGTVVSADKVRPLIYGGAVLNSRVYCDFGQGIGLGNFDGVIAGCTVVRFNGADSYVGVGDTSTFIDNSGTLATAVVTKCVGELVASNNAQFDNVTLDPTIVTGADSYNSVFDLSSTTFIAGTRGATTPTVVPTVERIRDRPDLFNAFFDGTFNTSAAAGHLTTLDFTVPVLSNATTTSVDVSVASGRLFWVVAASGQTLTASDIITGVGGWLHAVPQAPTSSGFVDVSATGTITPTLTVGGGESVYWCHVTGGGVRSAVSEAAAAADVTLVAATAGVSSVPITTGNAHPAHSFTVASGTNRLLLVGVSGVRFATSGSPPFFSGITYGGTGLTLLADQPNNTRHHAEFWYLVNPPVGTADVIATVAQNHQAIRLQVAQFDNVDQTTPLSSFDTYSFGGTNDVIDLSGSTTTDGSMVAAVLSKSHVSQSTVLAGATSAVVGNSGDTNDFQDTYGELAYQATPTAGAVNITWTRTGFSYNTAVGAIINPA